MKTFIVTGYIVCFAFMGFLIWKAYDINRNKPEHRTIPLRPFVIIGIKSLEPSAGSYVYQYELMDKSGNIFYITESAAFMQQPKRMLGDSIK